MDFPLLSNEQIMRRLTPPSGKVQAVLDTDTYNEIDDQFALVYAMLAPTIDLKAVYAAPFHNKRSKGAGDGMELSYEEILRLLDRLGVAAEGFAFRGSQSFMAGAQEAVASPAADDLVARAMAMGDDQPLYVIAIGAPTNVASAILLEPRIAGKIVVVWLGGHAHHWPKTDEFNCRQDMHASRILLDSGVPLVQIPCLGVASMLSTTRWEIEHFVRGQGRIGDYLHEIFCDYVADATGRSKVLWDLAAVVYLINHRAVPSVVVPSPILTDQQTWSFDGRRHPIRVAIDAKRDGVYHNLFSLLAERAKG